MKVLIVDDEKHVRDAIQMLIDWEHYGITDIYTAPEGATAVELIRRHHPDIIFTDMLMPIMSGSELLEWIQQNSPDSKTIVISGHDDFGYMRHTIKYGGMDYILKPIDEEQLNEALQKAIAAVRSERQMRSKDHIQSIQLNQIKPIYWDKIFSSILEEPHNYRSFSKELAAEFGLAADTKQARIAILTLDTMQKEFKDRFASNLDLLSFSIANIANEFLKQRQSGYAFRNWNKAHELIIIGWTELDKLPVLVEAINGGIYKTYGVRFDFGVGAIHSFPYDLSRTYEEALTVLGQRNLLQQDSWVHIYAAQNTPVIHGLNFHKHQEDIRMALLSFNPDQIKAAVSRWFAEIKKLSFISKEQLDLWQHEFTVFRARCLSGQQLDKAQNEHYSTSPFIIPIDENGRLLLSMWQQEFTELLISFSYLLTHQPDKPTAIDDIADYIQTHSNEEISLQDIADRFSLSREYISRRFKQERNENISDFISRIRIEKAKVLLLNPQLKIVQISEMVGYNDEKYFSKVFKKQEGMSPNEYRRTRE